MSDIFIDMDDDLDVAVTVGETDEEETFVEIPSPFTAASVRDARVRANIAPYATDCTVILTML